MKSFKLVFGDKIKPQINGLKKHKQLRFSHKAQAEYYILSIWGVVVNDVC